MKPLIETDDAVDTKRQATEEIQAIIRQCGEIITAAQSMKFAIQNGEVEPLRRGLKTFEKYADGFYDGYSYRLVIGPLISSIREHLKNLELRSLSGPDSDDAPDDKR